MQKFSVLMSIYKKEKPEYCRACFESLLCQTVPASEWVIVEDGPLTEELYAVLEEYMQNYPDLIVRVPLTQNVGLGMALREGIQHCSYELVARMDTDDICKEDRFEKQLQEFERDPELDICGSYMKEFETDITNITGVRKVPLLDAEIKEYQRRRDAFNHMTVMYRKSKVLAAGNYQHALLMEDSLLWINMILSGAKGKNIGEYLAFARANQDMIERRGGFSYFLKYKEGRKRIKETGYISNWDYYYTLLVQFVVAMAPAKLRKMIFRHLLRSKE